MRVLVTGGLGYIGSRVAAKLLDAGHHVTILDKGIYETPLVTGYVAEAEIVRAELAAIHAITSERRPFDWCFHLAALSNDGSADIDPHQTIAINVVATSDIARYCAASGVPMIFASTASAYGHIEWELSREDSPLRPQSIYAKSKVEAETALSKVAAETAIRSMASEIGLRCVILRQATVFGWSPRMRYDLVVNTLLKSAITTGEIVAHGGGECWRPLVYVGDLADVWLRVMEIATEGWWAAQDGCPTFNILHKNYRISELVWWMKLLLNDRGIQCEMIRDTMQPADNRDYAMDGSRARHAGLVTPTGITEAIDEMLEKIHAGVTADFDNDIYYNVRMQRGDRGDVPAGA